MVLKDIYFQTRWRIWDQIDSPAKNNQKKKKIQKYRTVTFTYWSLGNNRQ